jgi:anthranilate synthase component 2
VKILVFDNYDSFTYNLVHLVEKITRVKVDVYRNDELPLEKVKAYDKIILSPGPGIPEEAGLLLPLIKEYAASKPILGVCLGHQAIGEAFGGTLVNLKQVYHGVATLIQVGSRQSAVGSRETSVRSRETSVGSRESVVGSQQPSASKLNRNLVESPLFEGLPATIEVGRYHSWVVSEEGFPEELEITAMDDNGYIMGLQHKTYDLQGVQFHPESVLTPDGEKIMQNWLGK